MASSRGPCPVPHAMDSTVLKTSPLQSKRTSDAGVVMCSKYDPVIEIQNMCSWGRAAAEGLSPDAAMRHPQFRVPALGRHISSVSGPTLSIFRFLVSIWLYCIYNCFLFVRIATAASRFPMTWVKLICFQLLFPFFLLNFGQLLNWPPPQVEQNATCDRTVWNCRRWAFARLAASVSRKKSKKKSKISLVWLCPSGARQLGANAAARPGARNFADRLQVRSKQRKTPQ